MTDIFTRTCFPLTCEIITGISALLLQCGYLLTKRCSIRSIFLISLLTIPAVAISLESMNSFLTSDESYMIYEVVNTANDSLFMWNNGSFRTTDLLVGLPIHLLRQRSDISMDFWAVVAKSLHWIIGFCCIIGIINLALFLFVTTPFTSGTYLFLLYMIMGTPVVLLAQKVLNYDSLSLFFSIIAILLCIKGWRNNRSVDLYLCITAALLAAQEKLIASPLLWLLFIIVPVRIAFQQKDMQERICWQSLTKHSLLIVASSVSLLLIFHLLISMINTIGQPIFTAKNIFAPFLSGLWPFLRSSGKDGVTAPADSPILFIATAMALFTVFFLVQFSIVLLIQLAGKRFRDYAERLYIRYHAVPPLLFFFVVVVGVVATYTVHAYLAPYFPIETHTVTSPVFNNSSLYFRAQSTVSHTLQSICWAYATFANAFPSILIILSLILFYGRFHASSERYPVVSIIASFSLLSPGIFGILQIPASSRYFNIFIVLVTLWISIEYLATITTLKFKRAAILIPVLALLIEVTPFRPLFGAFRPIWSNYSHLYNTTPCKAMLNPWWMGWGEELFLAGKAVHSFEKHRNPESLHITLYHNYPGTWLMNDTAINTCLLDTAASVAFGDHDYFILNRMGIAQSSLPFPDASPLYTLAFRGFTTAWVFRGSDLPKEFFCNKNLSSGNVP